jgi:hypothetical protein
MNHFSPAVANGAIMNAEQLQLKRRCIVRGTLSKSWRLLALCGIANAIHAALNMLMLEPGGALGFRRFALPGAVWDMGMLAVAAGACAMAAGLWSSGRDHSWLLALHGVALGTFGVMGLSPVVRGPLTFRPVSLLFVVMAVSFGVFALLTARRLRSNARDTSFLALAGAVSIGFAFSFVAVGFRLVTLGPDSFWIWMGSYFGFCAMFMLWLAFRVHSSASFQSGQTETLPPLPRPRHAH